MKKILIVEDELLIAGSLERMLEKHGYSVPAIAIDYGQAIRAMEREKFDLVLLDVNLSGQKGGIEIAHKINEDYRIPFMYLTSNTDKRTIERLKDTKPAGYLSKPIQSASLTTNVDILFENLKKNHKDTEILIKIGSGLHRYFLEDIWYAQADHVYTELFHKKGSDLLRISLQGLMDSFPENEMIRINRSVAVRRKAIDRIDKTHVYLRDQAFKISRGMSDEVLDFL
ncbi:response regulator [Nonlabens antarcticus]|uniref:response regulator n=1 Tax=Nonlabens antarcticus TaxID=392714 RepID=UPI001891EC4B|nr:response regulator [Nonlabens antarcticus]